MVPEKWDFHAISLYSLDIPVSFRGQHAMLRDFGRVISENLQGASD